MARPSKERLDQIREWNKEDHPNIIQAQAQELLAEIDALESENAEWKLNWDNEFKRANIATHERDQLREKLAVAVEAFRQILYKTCDHDEVNGAGLELCDCSTKMKFIVEKALSKIRDNEPHEWTRVLREDAENP